MGYIGSIGIGVIFGIWDMFVVKVSYPDALTSKQWWKLLIPSLLLAVFSCWLWGFFTYQFIGFLLLTNLLLVMSVIDRVCRLIPDKGLLLYLPWILLYQAWAFPTGILWNSLLASVAGGGVMLVGWFFSKGSVGLGDVKLTAVCGLLTGFPGILTLLFRSMIFGMVYGIILLLRKKATLKTELPFAPFLFLGAIL